MYSSLSSLTLTHSLSVLNQGFESYMDSVDWMTSGVSFNPYQCYLTPLEVCVYVCVCLWL